MSRAEALHGRPFENPLDAPAHQGHGLGTSRPVGFKRMEDVLVRDQIDRHCAEDRRRVTRDRILSI
jgi:hypothetical protein